MRSRVLWTIVAFMGTFVVVYFILSGGFSAYNSRTATSSSGENGVIDDRTFGLPQAWIAKYHVSVGNEVDLLLDSDRDGLTLADEAAYDTNPYVADTDGDGYNDGLEVKNGYVPNGTGMMDVNHNDMPDKWEMEMFGQRVEDGDDDPDHDLLTNYDEYVFGTHPLKADTDGDGYNDGREIANGYDPLVPGDVRIIYTIAINKINVEAPIILSGNANEALLQKDLEHGVVHYPGTAYPGQRGNVYIAGHSSNYIWSKGAYNYIFKNLNDLILGDKIDITMTFANGKKIVYNYVVSSKAEVSANDERIFADSQSQELTLTTCWPLGTNARRMMIKAQLQDA